jgi:hypothetical protein
VCESALQLADGHVTLLTVSTALTELNSPPQSTTATPSRSAALGLKPRHISLVDNYLEYKVLWKAAELAGYTGSHQTLAQTARDTLNLPEVDAYYRERLQQMAVSADEVLAELGDIARAPWKDFIEVKYGEDGQVINAQLKLNEKIKALELAGKGHRLWAERVEVETSGDPSRLAGDLTAVLGVVREAIEAYRMATQAQMDQVVQGATESRGPSGPSLRELVGPASSSQPIIDVTPIDHVPLLPSAITTDD